MNPPPGALRTEGLCVAFGPFIAVSDISVAFEPGRRYALIGPNGAGKTTLLNALSGRQRPTSGRVFLGDADITRLPPHRKLAAGLGRSFQIVTIFDTLSVADNLSLAVQAALYQASQPWTRKASSDQQVASRVDRLLDETGLRYYAGSIAATLSHGEQRALELALALASEPAVLLLDEPLAGVGHARVGATMDLIRRVSIGRTVVLVEHNMDAVMGFADEILVLEAGRLLARGSPADIKRDPAVRKAYLGT